MRLGIGPLHINSLMDSDMQLIFTTHALSVGVRSFNPPAFLAGCKCHSQTTPCLSPSLPVLSRGEDRHVDHVIVITNKRPPPLCALWPGYENEPLLMSRIGTSKMCELRELRVSWRRQLTHQSCASCVLTIITYSKDRWFFVLLIVASLYSDSC